MLLYGLLLSMKSGDLDFFKPQFKIHFYSQSFMYCCNCMSGYVHICWQHQVDFLLYIY